MKILFCVIGSFLFFFSIFGIDDMTQSSLMSHSLDENSQSSSFEVNSDLIQHIHINARTNHTRRSKSPVIVFTNARDEKNIKEWAAHHLLLGFDLVYIFDHKSIKPLTKEFENFDKRVTVERCEWEGGIKMPLMNRAADIAKNLNASWMLYIDADEFLILNDFTDVKSLLRAFSHADSLGINWLYFGSNHHIEEPEGLILDNYTSSALMLDELVKSFVRPSQIVQAISPHFYCIKNSHKMYSINNKIMDWPCAAINPWDIEYFKSPAYLAHYVIQSEETYIKRKIALPRDDVAEFRSQIPNISLYFNDIENLDPKEKYSSRVKLFLEKW